MRTDSSFTDLHKTSPTEHCYNANIQKCFYYNENMETMRDVLRDVALVTGNSNPQLVNEVAALLGLHIHNVKVMEYKSGEINIKVHESVMGKDVYIIQSTCANNQIDINEALMELLFLIRKMKQGGAARITAVIPFFCYTRQNQKSSVCVPIGASAIASCIVNMGVDKLITLDLHSGQIQGYFDNVPLDNLVMIHEFAQYIRRQPWYIPSKCAVVSPDAGGVERAKSLADLLHIDNFSTIVNRRVEGGKVEVMQSVGEVAGLTCIIVDDLVDSGVTLMKACGLLKDMGAKGVICCCTHGVLSDNCCAEMQRNPNIDELAVSDSIPQDAHAAQLTKLVVLPIAPILAISILQLTKKDSTAALFTGPADPQAICETGGALSPIG